MDDADLDLSLPTRAGGPVPAAFPRRPGTGTQLATQFRRSEP